MTEKEKRQAQAEQFVERVLRDTFKQQIKPDQVKKVAAKVSKALPSTKRAGQMIAAE